MSDVLILTESKGTEKPLIPEGTWVDATVRKVEQKVQAFTDDDGNPVSKVEFMFDVEDPRYDWQGEDGRTFKSRLFGKTSVVFSTSPNCMLRAWTQEIMSVDTLPPGFQLRLADLEGNPVRILVGQRSYPDKKAPMINGEHPLRTINTVEQVARAAYNPAPVVGGGSPVGDDLTSEPF